MSFDWAFCFCVMVYTNDGDSLTSAMAEKYGYDSEEEFIKNAQKKFSLVETGVLDQDNCRLLMLNVCIPVSVLSREENKADCF